MLVDKRRYRQYYHMIELRMVKDLIWKKVGEDRHFKAGWRKMIHRKYVLINGVEAEYDLKNEGITVNILALTTENKVILVNVFRPGPEKVLKELPAGFVNKDEDPKKAAMRELLEETGYTGDFEFVTQTIDDGYSNCIRNCFVAKNCIKVAEPEWEDDEECEILEMDLIDFRKHLRSGQLCDIEIGYLGLDYLKLL
jgi:ADP-ribose pyrophosphatase